MMTWILGNIVNRLNPGQKAGGQKAEVEKVWPMNMGSFMIKTFKIRCAAGGRAIAAQKSDPN